MKKRVLSLFMVLVLCLTLLPTAAFAEGEDVSISGGVIGGGETGGEGGGIYVAPGSPTEGGGGTYIPGEDTRTEIWCVSKPDSIGRSYDGTTDGGTIPIDLTFTDGTNEIKLKEGTGFTAKKTFDSADAGWHTVTVEIELIGDAAAKYRLKAGEETFTIGGFINKAYPKLNVSLSKTACTAGEKLLPLLSVEGAPEDAEVTYYYLASALKSWAGSSDVEGSEAMPKIDENTAISEPGTYYVYAKTGETKNYKEERSATVELTVNEPVVEAASITKADGTDGGTYKSLPAALNAAQDGDTVKLLADHTTDWDAVYASEEQPAVVKSTITLDLNGKTVDYLIVGEVVPDEEGGILDSYDGKLTVVDNIQGGSCGKIKDLEFVKGSLAIQGGRIGDFDGSKLTCKENSGTVTISGGMVCNATVGDGAAVTVTGGTATVAAGTPITRAMEGVEVTVTAQAPDGMYFVKWVVKAGGVTLANETSATTTFTMPGNDVKIEATYKDAPTSHSVYVGMTYTAGNFIYQITSIDTATLGQSKVIGVVAAKKNKIKKVTIPDRADCKGYRLNVTAVGDKAFKSMKKLKKVTIGNKVTVIGENAFKKCSKLKTVVIGKAVKTISSKAFIGDNKIKKITFKGKKLKTVKKNAFSKKAKKNIKSKKTKLKGNKKAIKLFKKKLKIK